MGIFEIRTMEGDILRIVHGDGEPICYRNGKRAELTEREKQLVVLAKTAFDDLHAEDNDA